MQLNSYDPSKVVVNPALLARKGAPDKKKVQELAENMLSRREAGRSHQVQPGVVRENEDGTVECFVGQHRLAATAYLNTKISEDMESFPFWAIAVPSTDEQALVDAIEENAWRTATTLDDRAYAMGLLEDLKLTQEEIAKHFKVTPSTVSETLRYAKLPAKYKKMVREGLMTEEAAFIVARYNKDPKTQEDVVALSLQTRKALDDITARAEGKAGAEAEADAENAAEEGDEAETPKGGKKKASTAPKSDAVKKKAGGKKAVPGKVTAGDVKEATKSLGVKKKASGGEKKQRRTMTNLITFLEANFGPNVDEAVPEPYSDLAEKIEDWYEMKVGDAGLKNTWVKALRSKY